MQKYFEKIKERLEEEVAYQNSKADAAGKTCAFEEIPVVKAREKMAECYEHAIEVVDQVAEEFATDTNVGNKDNNQSLTNNNQSLANDGWIACSERLPERCEWYLVTYKFHEVPKATCHELYYGADYGYEPGWYLDDEYTELDAPFDVIAWRELPKPYQPKGE